jgi:hypothetical protein
MARSATDERRHEYEQLKAFFIYWETHLTPTRIFPLSDPRHPINMLSAIEQSHGQAKAFVGLKQAVGDVLDSAADFTPAFLAESDTALRRANLLTLSALVRRQSRQFKAILRRGKIRNETEFYLVSTVLADTTSELTVAESDLMGSMVAAFEGQRP